MLLFQSCFLETAGVVVVLCAFVFSFLFVFSSGHFIHSIHGKFTSYTIYCSIAKKEYLTCSQVK